MRDAAIIPLPGKNKRNFLGLGKLGWSRAKWFYLFLAPWMFGFVAFAVIPVLLGLAMSFTNFNGGNFNTLKFLGLANYIDAFSQFLTSGDSWYALQRTLLFTVITIPLNIGLSLLIAALLTRNLAGRAFFRTMFYLPTMLPLVASIWVFKSLLDNNFGVLNAILDKIVPGTHILWLTDGAFPSLIMWSIWAGLGGGIIIFMAGIQGVSAELRDAAAVDGANAFQAFFYMTLPMLTPLIMYQTVLGLIGGLQVLIPPKLLTPASGGTILGIATNPVRVNYMFMVHIYAESFNHLRFGYGSALLWILFVFILAVTLIFTTTSKYWVYYEVNPESQPGEE